MARIRSVKPELRRDLTVSEWPRECRYAWVLLWGYLDDHGRGLDDLRLLVADLFPLDRDVTERKLNGWLDLMAAPTIHGDPPLCRYEVGGRKLLHAPKWARSQRVSHPLDSRIPPCPTHEEGGNASGTVPESLPNQNGELPQAFRTSRAPEDLGSKGAREQGGGSGKPETPTPPDSFDAWWFAYPHKVGKDAARKAYKAAVKRATAAELLAGAERYRDDPTRDPAFTAHPSTWLNAGRWADEAPARPQSTTTDPRVARAERVLTPDNEWKREWL